MANNLQYLPPMGIGQPGAPVQQGGGGSTETRVTGYRNVLDARRSVGDASRVPSADYPDGYLGTINSRREDRLLKSVQSRLTQRSYQRGVHKGERVDPQDYVWNDAMDPQKGLVAEAQGTKWTASGLPEERLAHMGKVSALTPAEMLAVSERYGVPNEDGRQDPARNIRMQRLLPTWK